MDVNTTTISSASSGTSPEIKSPEAKRPEAADLARRFVHVRDLSLDFCQPLQLEDYGLQAIAETSPPKWHLAHTTWFFETFILKAFDQTYQALNPEYEVLFNSYYNGIGTQHPRAQRGLLSRPTVTEVVAYRQLVNEKILALLKQPDHPDFKTILTRIELGLHHEQQHQELLFTDLKYSFFQNPLHPVYCKTPLPNSDLVTDALRWHSFPAATSTIGHAGENFCFDNETPAHPVLHQGFQLAKRLITNGEYLAFIEDGAYSDPRWWLADGWSTVQQQKWSAPLYWIERDGQWFEYTLHGLVPLDAERPVIHVSAYEADAFARWYGARLANEVELEIALQQTITANGIFNEGGEYHPRAATDIPDVQQLHGHAWQWSSSAYGPYPGFQADPGAIGEYNGKFMCNQLVLRGSSCVTSRNHARASYRNFFYPQDRWQFSGIRLAKSL